jgi:hypothetical protein
MVSPYICNEQQNALPKTYLSSGKGILSTLILNSVSEMIYPTNFLAFSNKSGIPAGSFPPAVA